MNNKHIKRLRQILHPFPLENKKWDKAVKEYVQDVAQLLDQIESWLKAADPTFPVKREKTILYEEFGEYEVPRLKFFVRNHKVEIEPIGRCIIGALGRVDIKYAIDKDILLRTAKGVWKIFDRDTKRSVHLEDFDVENFVDIIERLRPENGFQL